jgi:MFS family permease
MQLAAPDRLRGRIIGIYFYAFNGTGPLGGLLVGWLCATGGTELAFFVAGILGLAGTAVAAQRFRDMGSPKHRPAQPVGGQGRSQLASVTHTQTN